MKLHHVAITIKDLKRSISFYEEFFGFKKVKEFYKDDLKALSCFLQGENIIIELWQFDTFKEGVQENMSFTGLKHIAFTDDDPKLLRETFIKKGISCEPLTTGSSGGLYFFLSDPDGNQIEIYKNKNLDVKGAL